VSFDCNYRPKLWAAWGGDPVHMIPQLMAEADLIFGGHRDIELVSGQKFADARAAADHAFLTFPRLQRLVCTRREQVSADHNRLAGLMYTRDETLETRMFEVAGIVDRIGGGDAFAAGVLHGLIRGETDAKALDYGIACGCLKHAQPGDLSLATAADLDGFLSDGGFDVRR
jgi:2-dehydro-3-deoxygluconokinase